METCKEKAKSAYDNEWMEHQLKKDIGAFYTPMPYARKASELVMKAVERVPEGNDYIILDRTAGTGNLEAGLDRLKDRNGDTLLSHCIVSTYDYREYKILSERIGRDVRNVIAPIKANVCFDNGVLSNSDALSEDYINNPIIKKYINDERCTVILFENPPYRNLVADHAADARRKGGEYVIEQSKQDLKGNTSNDLMNVFVWSAFHYYLRQPTDSYIVLAPIKYWKSAHIVDKKFSGGFIFNQKYFLAAPSAITCILWENIDEHKESIVLDVYDIKGDDTIKVKAKYRVKRVYHRPYELFKTTAKQPGDTMDGILCNRDGTECA